MWFVAVIYVLGMLVTSLVSRFPSERKDIPGYTRALLLWWLVWITAIIAFVRKRAGKWHS